MKKLTYIFTLNGKKGKFWELKKSINGNEEFLLLHENAISIKNNNIYVTPAAFNRHLDFFRKVRSI